MKKQTLSILLLLFACTNQAMLGSEERIESASLLEKYVPGVKLAKKLFFAGLVSAFFIAPTRCQRVNSCNNLSTQCFDVTGLGRFKHLIESPLSTPYDIAQEIEDDLEYRQERLAHFLKECDKGVDFGKKKSIDQCKCETFHWNNGMHKFDCNKYCAKLCVKHGLGCYDQCTDICDQEYEIEKKRIELFNECV